MRRLIPLLLAAAAAACVGGAAPFADPQLCASLFRTYDSVVRHYPDNVFNENGGVILRSPVARVSQRLLNAGCLTMPEDLDGLQALAQRLAPYSIVDSGPQIRPTPVHLGIVTGIYDEGRVTQFFRGLGYRSRGIGAPMLGRRIYIGVFTSQGALDQALAVAREAGFIAPYAAKYTRF
jgi:hypothetical protein